MKKIGLIARADNSGLGTLSREFFDNLPIARTLVVQNGVYRPFLERFPGAAVTSREIEKEKLDWLLDGIDVLLTFETPYSPQVFRECHRRGIKSVLMPMYECTPPFASIGTPNLVLCPSRLDFQFYKKYRAQAEIVFLPVPVNRKRLPWREVRKARTFVHNAGHGGLAERNGTSELLAAIPMVNSDVRFLINSQRTINYSHPKVELRIGNFENYWDLWKEGDIFVFPHKFDGLSLPIQEAVSVGMPVLSTRFFPFTDWLPAEWFFDASEIIQTKVSNTVREYIDFAVVKPADIAAKIDEMATADIAKMSLEADRIASALDWKVLKEKYITILSR